MRVTSYTRIIDDKVKDLMGYSGYCISGGPGLATDCYSGDYSGYQTIKAVPSMGHDDVEKAWSSIIEEIDDNTIAEQCSDYDGPKAREFYENYREIIKGEYPGFRLICVEVQFNSLVLFYTDEECYYYIELPYFYKMEIIGPRTRMGFEPKYEIASCDDSVRIQEDCWYVRRDIFLFHDDEPGCSDNAITRMEVTEYTEF